MPPLNRDSTGLRVYGCGLDFKIGGAKRANYSIVLSVITPYLRLTGDGKAPFFGHFKEAIEDAVRGAAGQACRNLAGPAAAMSIADAAYAAMEEAYLKASDNGALPAKAPQIMYAARPRIPGSAPERVGEAHVADQLADFERHFRSAAARARLPSPEQPKPGPMRADDRLRLDDHQGVQNADGIMRIAGLQPTFSTISAKSGHYSASIDGRYSPESGGGLTLLAPRPDTEPDSRFQQ